MSDYHARWTCAKCGMFLGPSHECGGISHECGGTTLRYPTPSPEELNEAQKWNQVIRLLQEIRDLLRALKQNLSM
jgi:hypothetical protein